MEKPVARQTSTLALSQVRFVGVLCSRAEVPGKEDGLCPVLPAATGCRSRLIAVQQDIVRHGT
jgi:hypothetical protein